LKQWDAVYSCFSFGEYYHVVMKSTDHAGTEIETYLKEQQFVDIEVKQIDANIEDSFMALMHATHE